MTTRMTISRTTRKSSILLITHASYSDDEDVSWKIRRSAAKLIHALIGTRNELLFKFYDIAAPVLIPRFSEREESVRLEVLSAFEILLKQTASAHAAEIASGGRNKRKRSHDMDDDSAAEDRFVCGKDSC
jgi:cullin-associated NEDD8-dissociated protein 1